MYNTLNSKGNSQRHSSSAARCHCISFSRTALDTEVRSLYHRTQFQEYYKKVNLSLCLTKYHAMKMYPLLS